MALREELQIQGGFLFRYRSYLPLCVFPVFFIALFSMPQFMIKDNAYNNILISICLLVGLAGQFIRILVAGFAPVDTSGRNTKEQKASSLNTTGIYSICRNPLYIGNFLMMLAPVLLLGNWLFALSFTLAFWLYYERIIYAEECFLREKFGQEYLDWSAKTPIFIPNIFSKHYTKNKYPFSLKSMLKREYHSLFGLTSSLLLISYIISLYESKSFIAPSCILSVAFIISLVIYLVCLLLAKKTNLLNAQGR